MKLISWNVNGIRAVLKKGFLDYVVAADPEILCLQETKAHPEQVDLALTQYPYHYWNSADKKGYSGTAVFSKVEPINVLYKNSIKESDTEGRIIALEFEEYYLVNVYTPNAQRELTRLDFRINKWDAGFLRFLKKLRKNKPVICCGDFNVAHKEIDLARPKANEKNAGFTPEERKAFSKYVDNGFLDTFRIFNQEPNQYSWWSYRAGAREKNIGWRIDYFLASEELKPRLKSAWIDQHIFGSDHCPVGLELN